MMGVKETKERVETSVKFYEDELQKEIEEERENHKKTLKFKDTFGIKFSKVSTTFFNFLIIRIVFIRNLNFGNEKTTTEKYSIVVCLQSEESLTALFFCDI